MVQHINLLELDKQSNQLLAKLFATYPDKVDWAAGSYFIDKQEISISHRIIKHYNATGIKHVYEVLDDNPIDQGCFGTVFLSKLTLVPDQQYDELIVKTKSEIQKRLIKIQNLKYFSKERAEREVENLRQIGFFHCKPLSYNSTDSFITMRKLPGQPLQKIIEENKLTLLERYQLTKSLVLALKEQVHDADFIHRDIKPQNILVDGHSIIYFVDYALAIHKHYDDRYDTLRGSIPYVAPEGFSPHDCTTIKSDVYALGRVLMMLWGDDYRNNPDFNPVDCVHSARNVSFVRLYNRLAEIPECHMELRSLLYSMLHEESCYRPPLENIMDVLNALSERMQPIPNPKWNNCSFKLTSSTKSTSFYAVPSDSILNNAPCLIDQSEDSDEGYSEYYGF
ncbi:protein kinase domain-containing protein [Legionella quateirensis]|uniref:Ser/Thr protein kinase n=1 Tax=Legionella quateirensis TaxID=45072 RepID=A0A378KPQ0_9GAMM|nr:protein kinase [Legionella quateirensis]KTD54696.1 putative protein kinase [Legionella quateirensis]STY16874.1 Ser/Thr protein kinase [Legionella quateirensis]